MANTPISVIWTGLKMHISPLKLKLSETLYDSWKSIVMHLPYAYQGRRMLTEIYALDASNATITGTENAEEYQNKLREISKSGTYKSFCN
jgi:hydroxymethylglutaryl-CoA synthase